LKYFIEQRGKKTICSMAQDTDFGRDVTDGVRDELKALNVKLAGETLHKPTDTDFSASVARLRDVNCDLVVFGTIVRDTIQIISAIRKVGWNVDMLGQFASYDAAVAEMPGGTANGFYSMSAVVFATGEDAPPAAQAFAKKYKALYGKDPNMAAQLGYTGASLVMQALKNAGPNLNVDSFVSGMESIKDYHDIFGSPPMTFSPTKHQGSNQAFLSMVRNGHWEQVDKTPLGY
jgi:branched-chain amino acid transport system substrate-binding protein